MTYIRKITVGFVGLFLVCGLLTACASTSGTGGSSSSAKSSESSARVLKDAMDHKVKVPAHAKRVLASYMEDDLTALGVKPVAQWSINNGKGIQDYLQKSLQGVPTVPYDLPYEAVASFKPDLILIQSAAAVSGGKYAQYQKIAPTYVVDKNINNDWRNQLQKVARVLGKKQKAKQVLADYDRQAADAKKQIKQAVGRPSAAAIWLTGNKFFIVGENVSSGSVLYHDLGLKAPQLVQDISKSATANWSPVSLEKLAKLDANYIFLVNSDKSSGSTMLKESLWKNIPAVKKHHVYEYGAASSWLYSGPIANAQIIDGVLKNIAAK
ncbi:MAG: iron-hydroxamate ABC transporter substrate-binding protein [Sporolactobacillus sp.]|jgi:iron complex transport system substrate-binding protein|nr:iron-hydroxamate ABC transporter substrate-binding protein [Sporolactobacillus sp.]